MKSPHTLSNKTLADTWADLKAHADAGIPLEADAYRLAFADPEFLLRRETRGIRFQLEMLKPDLAQQEQGVNNNLFLNLIHQSKYLIQSNPIDIHSLS